MSTVTFVSKKCFLCGKTGRFGEIGVHNLGKAEDLDGRPGDSSRSSIYILIKRCISCGYCSPEISEGSPQAAEIIKNPLYIRQLGDKSLPETATAFLCWAMIQEKIGRFNEAGMAALYAAWICDDSDEHPEKATECREKAVNLLKEAKSVKQSFCETEYKEQLLLIDLYRRCGLFKEARVLCENEIKKPLTDEERMILLFQEDLLDQKDRHKHTRSEATAQ